MLIAMFALIGWNRLPTWLVFIGTSIVAGTYNRTNHRNLHVRGYKERGNINTPLELAIENEIARFTLAIDVIDRTKELLRSASKASLWVSESICLSSRRSIRLSSWPSSIERSSLDFTISCSPRTRLSSRLEGSAPFWRH